MPELPEVETIVRGLNKEIRGKKILKVWTDWPKYFWRSPGGWEKFEKEIKGKEVRAVKRVGKNIIFDLGEKAMLVHLKMTGRLVIGKWIFSSGKWKAEESHPHEDKISEYLHLMFWLFSGRMLGFSDMRKFGKIILADRGFLMSMGDIKNIGPDPLEKRFGFRQFNDRIKPRGGFIKKVLMNQTVIAGVGNIYSDEALFLAKIHPLRKAENLDNGEIKLLLASLQKVLKKSLRLRGTSISDYRDHEGKKGGYADARLVYKRVGMPCLVCGARIQNLKLGGRTANFCPVCQTV